MPHTLAGSSISSKRSNECFSQSDLQRSYNPTVTRWIVTSLKIALRETFCKKLKSVPPLCVTCSECRALFRVENLPWSAKFMYMYINQSLYFQYAHRAAVQSQCAEASACIDTLPGSLVLLCDKQIFCAVNRLSCTWTCTLLLVLFAGTIFCDFFAICKKSHN